MINFLFSYSGNAFKSIYLFVVLIFIQNILFAQVTLKGPTCVVPGTTYQYIINAQWDSTSTMQACINSGVFSDGTTCTSSGKILNELLVVWNNNVSGNVSITSSKGNTTLNVDITSELNGGSILQTEKFQNISNTNSNYFFHCSSATGGSCSPVYNYQWQYSIDRIQWKNINGATSSDLTFSDSIQTNTFFRRVVDEKKSTTKGYSDIGQLIIEIPIVQGDSLHNTGYMLLKKFKNNFKADKIVREQENIEYLFLKQEYVSTEDTELEIF